MIARLITPTRTETEALLDRALRILRGIHADIAHPAATAAPGDDALRREIETLFAMVKARRERA